MLKDLGYAECFIKRYHLAANHIIFRITYGPLKRRVSLIYRLNIEEYKKDFAFFMSEVAKEAATLHKMEIVDSKRPSDNCSEPPKHRSNIHGKGKFKGKTGKNADTNRKEESEGNAQKGKRKKPSCLNPQCSGYHLLVDCPVTSQEDKKKFLEEIKSKMKRGGAINATHLQWGRNSNSSLFEASFENNQLKCQVLADQGSDVCILPPNIYEELKQKSDIGETVLEKTMYYPTVDSDVSPLPCSRKFKATIKIKVRNASSMILRKVTWMVSDRPVRNVILGRDVLLLLGLDNQYLLSVACDRLNGELDVEEKKKEPQHGEIRSLMGVRIDGQTYHSSSDPSDDDTPEDMYMDIGFDKTGEVGNELESRIKEALEDGLYEAGEKFIRSLLKKHRDIFRIRLRDAPPAKVKPMKIRIEPGATP